MRIESLQTVRYALPFREPYVSARGTLERRDLLLVRLQTSGGPTGLGEAAPLALRGGPDLAAIERELAETCAPLLRGSKLTVSSLSGLIAAVRSTGVSRQALCAVDLALHDLAAKVEGEPLWRLLGAARPSPVRCNATLPAGEPAHVAGLASTWADRGFDTFKLKVGVERDRETARAVREAVGPAARLRIDANGVWSAADASARLRELEPLQIELAEQPAASLEDLAAVRRRTRIPIAADESVVGAEDAARAVGLGACDLATVKLAKAGGIAAAFEVAAEIPLYLSSALDGPVGIAAAAALAAALPASGPAAGLAHGLATGALFATDVAARGPELSGADLLLSDEPGHGVEIDDLALARARI